MSRSNLVKTLMQMNDMTEEEAIEEVKDARKELLEDINNGEMPFDFCADRWGLEPDYLEDLLF